MNGKGKMKARRGGLWFSRWSERRLNMRDGDEKGLVVFRNVAEGKGILGEMKNNLRSSAKI